MSSNGRRKTFEAWWLVVTYSVSSRSSYRTVNLRRWIIYHTSRIGKSHERRLSYGRTTHPKSKRSLLKQISQHSGITGRENIQWVFICFISSIRSILYSEQCRHFPIYISALAAPRQAITVKSMYILELLQSNGRRFVLVRGWK